MTELPPINPEIEQMAQAMAILRTMLTPRQMLHIAECMRSVDQVGFGEVHIIWFNGDAKRVLIVNSDNLPK